MNDLALKGAVCGDSPSLDLYKHLQSFDPGSMDCFKNFLVNHHLAFDTIDAAYLIKGMLQFIAYSMFSKAKVPSSIDPAYHAFMVQGNLWINFNEYISKYFNTKIDNKELLIEKPAGADELKIEIYHIPSEICNECRSSEQGCSCCLSIDELQKELKELYGDGISPLLGLDESENVIRTVKLRLQEIQIIGDGVIMPEFLDLIEKIARVASKLKPVKN